MDCCDAQVDLELDPGVLEWKLKNMLYMNAVIMDLELKIIPEARGLFRNVKATGTVVRLEDSAMMLQPVDPTINPENMNVVIMKLWRFGNCTIS